MKIIQTQNLKLNTEKQNNKQDLSFTGGETVIQVLNFLDTNQTMGACVVDVGCMGLPRSAVDFTRGPEAGIETMRREFTSTINDASLGLWGLGAACLLSGAFNNRFGVKAHKMFVSDETLEVLAKINDKHGNIGESDVSLKNYLNEIFENAKGFNPEHYEKSRIDERGWVGIDNSTRGKVVEKLTQELKNNSKKMSKDAKIYLKDLLGGSTGSEKNFKVEQGKITAFSSLDDLIDSVYKVSKAFMNKKVAETFKNGNLADNLFIKRFKKLNRNKTILGLAASMAVGLSVQPINSYLTKLKTGKEGFVGVEGREPDKSNEFKLLKLCIASIAMLLALRTIGKTPKEIFKNIQFKGFLPTIDQFKLVYGATIASRILSARDKNELRETSIKDSLGFTNWLILGGFVSKLVAAGFEKMSRFKNDKFIRYNKAENGKNRLIKSSIVSREEVLHSALKKAGISTIKSNGIAMTFKEMLKELNKTAKAGVSEAIHARSKIRYLGFIQLAGYLYSGLVLGIGVPKLNIAITKAVEKKRKAKETIVNKQAEETQKAA